MTPSAMAELHAQCFTTPRPWKTDEFASLLRLPNTVLAKCRYGFALGHVAGEDAELWTIAIAPDRHGKGWGTRLLNQFESQVYDMGAECVMLEVASNNIAAHALYGRAGYRCIGQRKGYFTNLEGQRLDAHVLRKTLNTEGYRNK